MSMERVCHICGKKEWFRLNFGDNHEAEREFHSEKGCLKICDNPEADNYGESIL